MKQANPKNKKSPQNNTRQTTKKKTAPQWLFPSLTGLFLLLGYLGFFSARWFVSTYGRLGFDSILYTLSSDLGGVQSGLIWKYLLFAFLPACVLAFVTCAVLYRKPKSGKYLTASRRIEALLFGLLIACVLLVIAAFDVELVDYIIDQFSNSGLYEKYYVNPNTVNITFPREKRNLIYIILESMETSYLPKELGGAMGENLIPELYELAADNTCFSNSGLEVGGFYTTAGATWTIGSMVAQTAGIPLKTPTEDVNKYGAEGEAFLPGVTSLTSILHDAGYYQALMVGSDASFGGREPYFLQHGMDAVYDVYTARREGIIPRDYWTWWGMEDLHLFNYAKQKLTEIAAGDQPFAFTMLTVDTHHVGGYQCDLCLESTSGETYDQSISCSSRQVAEFVNWIRQQPFYEDTTIIIVGDHESMDNGYFERNVDENYQRLLYNCFINAAPSPSRVTNRKWAAVDLFPTTLAAIGCTIEGDRLGLGTNLFSSTLTLTEKMGFQKFNDELAKASDYYEQHFWS